VLREVTNSSTKTIGDILGGKDHSTVIYYLRKIEKSMQTNNKLKMTVNDIVKNIKGRS